MENENIINEQEQVEAEVIETSVTEELPICEESSGLRTILAGAAIAGAAAYGVYSFVEKIVKSERVQGWIASAHAKHEENKSKKLEKKAERKAKKTEEPAKEAADSDDESKKTSKKGVKN